MSANLASSAQDIHALARFNMVESQIRPNRVTDERLLGALAELPREIFVPEAMSSVAYADKSLSVAPGRFVMEPLFLARLLQEAAVGPDDKVLVVGPGTGFSAAVAARLAGSVVAIESDGKLAAASVANLTRLGIANVAVEVGPLPQGWPGSAPYDVVLIDGMIAALPEAIAAQLAEGGRLVAIQSQERRCGAGMLYRKLAGAVSGRVLFDAVEPFLPGFEPVPAFVL